MDWYAEDMSQNVLKIDISPTQMVSSAEKKYKIDKMKEIISAVCALFNSGGGTLELQFDSATPKQHKDACIRMIDQRVVGMVGITTATSHLKFDVNSREIILHIREASKLVSVNYNLYLPCESQVVALPATEPTSEIKEMIQRKIVEQKTVQIGSHSKGFVKGQNSGLDESTVVQKKFLKANPSRCVTLADRITGKSNKLTSYISAFANHLGGHIYYGITDNGITKGEVVTDKDKEEIIEKVAKAINKMKWPQNYHKPQRGKQWNIFFEPVVDARSNPIPSTFVIIISVRPCVGGVFTEAPESYYVVEGKMRKMSFQDWWRCFTGISKYTEFQPIPSQAPRVQWSSEKNRQFCLILSERLAQYRNDGDTKAFKTLSQLAIEHFPACNAHLIVTAEEIVVAFKFHNFRKSESLLAKFESLLKDSADSVIFEVRLLLLRSMIEHSRGNYLLSYERAQHGLQMMQLIPADLTTVELYIQAAMVNAVLTATHDIETGYRSHKDAGQLLLQLAAKDANSLEDPYNNEMFDLQQKLHIYKAWILLECSITGQEAQQNRCVPIEDIDAAAGELASVSESVLKGNPLTQFRKIQYDLAQCDLFRRRSETQLECSIQNLKQAFECAWKARAAARKHRFGNMQSYANKRLAYLTENLVRHAVQTRGYNNNQIS